MQILLLTVTAASLVSAAFLGWTAWRLARRERDRALARVAALAAAAAEPTPTLAPEDAVIWAREDARELPLHPDEEDGAPSAPPVPSAPAFLQPPPPAAARQSALAVAAVVLLAALGAAGAWMYASSAAAREAGRAPAPPLELLALGQTRQGQVLSVTGTVRNPAGGTVVDALSATVMLFDGQGGYLTSVRGTVERPRLGPGEASPFTLSVPTPVAAARYRVSFRARDRLVPHVDRRAATAAASARTGL